MLTIDGSFGEGGGQVLRTAVALSAVTGRAVRIIRIRAGRKKPGLMRQHLTAVLAAAKVAHADVQGAEPGSQEVVFRPEGVEPGEFHFSVGTAGSTTLVLQTILPALLTASGPSQLILEGGTHNLHAPPFDFLQKSFLPLIGRMGPRVDARLERPGFYPGGGGRCAVAIAPAPTLRGFDVLERGPVRRITATAMLSALPHHIGEREIGVIESRLAGPLLETRIEAVASPAGPGNAVLIEVESAQVTEVFTSFGARGIRAEAVAARAVEAAERYLAANVPVGEQLADQLLLPLALAGCGSFRTLPPTQHTLTNIAVIERFLPVAIRASQMGEHIWQIDIAPRNPNLERK